MADARGEVLRGLPFLVWGRGVGRRIGSGAGGDGRWLGDGGGARGAAEYGARRLLGVDGVRGPSYAAGLVAQGGTGGARGRGRKTGGARGGAPAGGSGGDAGPAGC